MTLTIGQQGKLGNEVLTVISFNEKMFKCDNGKMYLIANAKWMTDGVVTAERKEKSFSPVMNDLTDFYSDENAKNIDFEAIQQKARMNQRGSSMR